MTVAIVALALSAFLLASIVVVLVLLRRGDGPTYGTSRLYDANRREAIRLLTGERVEAISGEQWFLRGGPAADEELARNFRDAALEAMRAAVPADRGLAVDGDRARLAGAEIVPAVSTVDFRDALAREPARDGTTEGLLVALVLVNPEPPGGDAGRLALPIQVLFPALERAGRGDLVQRFAALRDRAAASHDAHALTTEAS